jgi:regulator of protease activity HflC (stomatin/prohibitin superfamily)
MFLPMLGVILLTFLFLVSLLQKASPKPIFPFISKLKIPLVIFGILMIVNPFVTIPAGSKGLIFTFGKIENRELNPGLSMKFPLVQNIEIITVRPIQITTKITVGPDGAITKDNQTIGAEMVIMYKYKQNELVKMWDKFGKEKVENVVINSVIESFKAEIGTHQIFDIPLNQNKIRNNTFNSTQNKIKDFPVELVDLKLLNYDWSDEFDKQIQQTMHIAQQVKQAEQSLQVTEKNVQKEVKQAEADKLSAIARAEGEKESARLRAEAKALEGEGIRKYNESIRATMDLELKIRQLEIEKIKANKWNGQYVPQNHYGPIPISSAGLQPNQ